jgi:hypothetical protein
MKYRGVSYTIIRGDAPDVWRWSVMVGRLQMLRIGQAATEQQAEAGVHQVIDRALKVEESPRFFGRRKADQVIRAIDTDSASPHRKKPGDVVGLFDFH